MINNPVEFGTWAAGWSIIEFYTIGSQTYALFFSRTDGSVAFYNDSIDPYVWNAFSSAAGNETVSLPN